MTLKVRILKCLRMLFIILVSPTMTWFSKKMLIPVWVSISDGHWQISIHFQKNHGIVLYTTLESGMTDAFFQSSISIDLRVVWPFYLIKLTRKNYHPFTVSKSRKDLSSKKTNENKSTWGIIKLGHNKKGQKTV